MSRLSLLLRRRLVIPNTALNYEYLELELSEFGETTHNSRGVRLVRTYNSQILFLSETKKNNTEMERLHVL